jgi:protein required for attachment to host cells
MGVIIMARFDSIHPIEQLRQLGHAYHHLQQEHQREAPQGATRRRLEVKLERIAARFQRLLEHWVREPALQEQWMRYLQQGAPAPEQPEIAPPPLFRGTTGSGAEIELRVADDGGYDIFMDGKLSVHESVPWHLDPDAMGPVQVGEHSCRERFEAPGEAIMALEDFLSTAGAQPPWRWLRALFEDGLVDAELALTPRGRRRLAHQARRARPAASAGERVNYCVLVVDAARARVLTLETDADELLPTFAELVEVADITNPARRARPAEFFSDTRSGQRREGSHGPLHGVDDRRDRHHRGMDRRFAALAADQAAELWRRYPACRVLVVAAPRMLGLLRPAIAERMRGQTPHDVRELARDLTRLAPATLHDALAEAGLLPARRRLPPPWQSASPA